MGKQLSRRIDHLEDISARKKEQADEQVRAILRALPLDVKELALDAQAARARGSKLTVAQRKAIDQLEAVGYFKAVEDALPFETETEKVRSTELVQRMTAGDDWREITLSTRRI